MRSAKWATVAQNTLSVVYEAYDIEFQKCQGTSLIMKVRKAEELNLANISVSTLQ